jgi:hypothetical protein
MKTKRDSSQMIGLCHVGMYAKDPASLAEFHRDVMGMQVVGSSDATWILRRLADLYSRKYQPN